MRHLRLSVAGKAQRGKLARLCPNPLNASSKVLLASDPVFTEAEVIEILLT